MIKVNKEVGQLPEIVASLNVDYRKLVERIFDISRIEGTLDPPDSMRPWIIDRFGSVEAVVNQSVVRVTNRVTYEEALFNPLRLKRPHSSTSENERWETGLDIFRNPYESTPADTFGRVKGRFCVTSSNIAKYDGLHGLIIYDEFNPLRFDKKQIVDYIDTALKWARQANKAYPEAKYFMFLWNCGYRAGASLIHGHAQVVLAQKKHYAKIEQLRLNALQYYEKYGRTYFADLILCYTLLGCGLEKDDTAILANLTPVKENEVILMGDELTASFKEKVYEVLSCLIDQIDVRSFNLALIMPPIAKVEEDWTGFPTMVRIVDRGNEIGRTSDIGTMELYAASVISSDPFTLMQALRSTI